MRARRRQHLPALAALAVVSVGILGFPALAMASEQAGGGARHLNVSQPDRLGKRRRLVRAQPLGQCIGKWLREFVGQFVCRFIGRTVKLIGWIPFAITQHLG